MRGQLGGKRKLNQLDGSASDDEDTVEWQDAAEPKVKILLLKLTSVRLLTKKFCCLVPSLQREELHDADSASVEAHLRRYSLHTSKKIALMKKQRRRMT